MDHGASGEIEGFNGSARVEGAAHHSTGGPDHVSKREVYGKHPQRDKKEDGGELHSFGDGAHDECGCNYRESKLEHGPHAIADPMIASPDFSRFDSLKEGIGK